MSAPGQDEPTPRTDVLVIDAASAVCNPLYDDVELVPALFARTLERETIVLTAQLAEKERLRALIADRALDERYKRLEVEAALAAAQEERTIFKQAVQDANQRHGKCSDKCAQYKNEGNAMRVERDQARGMRDAAQAKLATAQAERDEATRTSKIAELKSKGTLANNLCPDHRDKQVGKPCLACNIETLERKLATAERDALEFAEAIFGSFITQRVHRCQHCECVVDLMHWTNTVHEPDCIVTKAAIALRKPT